MNAEMCLERESHVIYCKLFFQLRIARRYFPKGLFNTFYPVQEILNQEDLFYDYYAETSLVSATETKWNNHFDHVKNI